MLSSRLLVPPPIVRAIDVVLDPFAAKVMSRLVELCQRFLGSEEDFRTQVWSQNRYNDTILALREHFGTFCLISGSPPDDYAELMLFLQAEPKALVALDVVEIVFNLWHRSAHPDSSNFERMLGQLARQDNRDRVKQTADFRTAVKVLNKRLAEHGVPFQLTSGKFIAVDAIDASGSVEDTLGVLNLQGWAGPLDEYTRAIRSFNVGETKASVLESAKAVESAIKCVAQARNWTVGGKAVLGELLGLLRKHSFFPRHYEEFAAALPKAVDGALAGTRGSGMAAHGQGQDIHEISIVQAKFVLQISGAFIQLIIAVQDEHGRGTAPMINTAEATP